MAPRKQNQTHYTFKVEDNVYQFPHLKDLPAGFIYYNNKIAKLSSTSPNDRKMLEYNGKIMEFVFGKETEALDAFMSFTFSEQGTKITEWKVFEENLYGASSLKS